MKKLFIFSFLLLTACSKNQEGCTVNGTALYNGNTVQLVNGACSMTSQTIWQNPNYYEFLICNKAFAVQNNLVCQTDPATITNTMSGCTPITDSYQVFPSTDGKSQCWFKITNGSVDPNAALPTF